jgi:glyceraldehyde 3-phosphate dehydrogenase
MRRAGEGKFKGILSYCDEPLVSSDYNHNPHSAVYDAMGTMVMSKRLCTVMAWYDNEWGFSLRMLDTGAAMAWLDARGQ